MPLPCNLTDWVTVLQHCSTLTSGHLKVYGRVLKEQCIYFLSCVARDELPGHRKMIYSPTNGRIILFLRNSGAPPETLSNVKYDAPREVCGDRK